MQILNGEKITLGTCYYPEHWDEALWREDLSRMLACGIEVIRIAEFAWNKIEPAEGVYNYDFFDRFLDVAEEAGMKVIMGTPTATPPAWRGTTSTPTSPPGSTPTTSARTPPTPLPNWSGASSS